MKATKSTAISVCKTDKIFYTVVNVIMILILLIVLVPMLNVIASSFSSGKAVASGKVGLWPVDFSVEGYAEIFKNKKIIIGYSNTIFYTIIKINTINFSHIFL